MRAIMFLVTCTIFFSVRKNEKECEEHLPAPAFWVPVLQLTTPSLSYITIFPSVCITKENFPSSDVIWAPSGRFSPRRSDDTAEIFRYIIIIISR